MTRITTAGQGAAHGASTAAIGSERLLGIPEVCAMTGFCPVTASKVMHESGKAITLHRKIFILESSLFAYLHELEGANADE